MEAETDTESVGIPEDISGRENDALGLEHRPAEFLAVLESTGNRREPVYTRWLKPVEVIALEEFGDTFSVRFRVSAIRLQNVILLLSKRL